MEGVTPEPVDPASYQDPYLRWLIASKLDLFRTRERDGDEAAVGLLIEWKSLDYALNSLPLLKASEVWVPKVYADPPRARRIWVVSVRIDRLEALLGAIGPRVCRVELASPVRTLPASNLEEERPRKSQGPVLAAVLDDGCAFANQRFRDASGTRIVWLWNQDAGVGSLGRPTDGSAGPSRLVDFSYGQQWAKVDLDVLVGKVIGADESSAYEALGMKNLRRSIMHGTHVLDLFAGGKDWDIAFVQFPVAAIDDPSGRWLGRHALDGLHYVLECAGPQTRTIVVNISWGPQTGPHDGTSLLETAIDELVADQRALGKELVVCLPSGNTFGAQAHACLDAASGGSLEWNVPPDAETPAFLEIWWPDAIGPDDICLSITPPGGAATTFGSSETWVAGTGWFAFVQRPLSQGAMVLIAVNPTGGIPQPTSPPGVAGRWILEFGVSASGLDGPIHLYVARADHNMGAKRRAKSSYLSDLAHAAGRFRSAQERDAEVRDSSIRRAGTLNGLATGRQTKVATGYSFDTLANARYSSSGPARKGPCAPEFSCVTDRSRLRQGVAATGVRSGTKAVLIGTSTAAPQMARQFGDDSLAVYETVPQVFCRDPRNPPLAGR